ncbi:hypothetical protein VSR01_17460 [Actinacidiphila sp. DG2A-62]|uniref:hypothetical protein n=1 Tax=Actinacidiphila sp. DG2A-62 TaxID=3108821 RepID=UPI002DB86DCC|nr:hypothetical protein [Actinacidiphila sp. DG2A-62]MEC3995227.1 hypothetical protein [Actinacidiphila sp. DG2A-62]
MPMRQFTRAQLADLGVPPDSPEEIEYSETVLADEPVTTLKYSMQRRCVFRADDDKTYAVTYEAELDTGDYELGPPPENHGWYGDTVEAEEVEPRYDVVRRWRPIADEPDADAETRTVAEHLVDMYEEGGVPTRLARQYASDWLTDHADELSGLFGDDTAGDR